MTRREQTPSFKLRTSKQVVLNSDLCIISGVGELDTPDAWPLCSEQSDAHMLLVYRYRVKDKHASELRRQARAVNIVFNYCNETQQRAVRSGRRWMTYHDLARLTAGAGKELNIHSHTVQRVCREYDKSRDQYKKAWLKFRGRKSLGWVPFNTGHVTFKKDQFVFRGKKYDVWLDRMPPADTRLGAGSFSADTRGRWYLNVPVDVQESDVTSISKVGIDLGLKDLATCSDGVKVAMPRFARKAEQKIATAQRAKKKKQARNLHAKVANQRKDYLHKTSSQISKKHGLIIVGDVSSSKLAKTWLAKSVLDAGWSDLKNMLRYKAVKHGGAMIQVSEAYSSQICSCCGVRPASAPRGVKDLDKRIWVCSECGTEHDRDVNAANNIRRLGLESLEAGAPKKEGVFSSGRGVAMGLIPRAKKQERNSSPLMGLSLHQR